jgi:membrane protease subunit (stomatin/prohibitin family)
VNLRVFGEYRWRVSSAENFINQFVGTFDAETSADVESRLKEQMVILIYNAMGKMKSQGLKVTDLAANLTNIEQVVLSTSADNIGQYGIEINKVSGLTISLPDEVQKAIDTRSQMQVLGVNYLQYQAGQAMTDAANNPSGTAGVGAGLGVGLGAGVGVGSAFGQAMMGGMNQGPTRSCSNCGSIIPLNTAFCPNCGAAQTAPQQQQSQQQQPKVQQALGSKPKFCPNCGTAVSGQPKFCPNCGSQL